MKGCRGLVPHGPVRVRLWGLLGWFFLSGCSLDPLGEPPADPEALEQLVAGLSGCTDIPPEGPYSCAEQAGWGKCGEPWMEGFCDQSCGRCAPSAERLWLPSVLSDHLVIQQKRPFVLWGRARPGTRVRVTLSREADGVAVRSGEGAVRPDGGFEVVLPALEASFTAYRLRIDNDGTSVTRADVVVGEVWLSSGQSNMELQLQYTLEREPLLAEPGFPFIRIFYQDGVSSAMVTKASPSPLAEVSGGSWKKAEGAEAIGRCSAISYTFARALFLHFQAQGKQVPVGVLPTAVGATSIVAWMSREKLAADPVLAARLPASWQAGSAGNGRFAYQQATACFNHKIAPLRPLALRGFLWAQGESDAGAEARTPLYRRALEALIQDWRGQFGSADLPFLLTQLHPAERTCDSAAALDEVAIFREAQLEAAAGTKLTVAVPTSDLDPTWDWGDFAYAHPVHPLSKQPVGERLARAAFALAHGEGGEYTGPLYERMERESNRVTVWFSHTGDGLRVGPGGGTLRGFALAGKDRVFVPASARITGSRTVEVTSPKVPEPQALTYAFTLMNQEANLVNASGLPAAGFRSDKVPSDYVRVRPKLFYEGELQKIAALSAGDRVRDVAGSDASRGVWKRFEADAIGDFLAYRLTVYDPVSYRIALRARRGQAFGQFQVRLDGAPLGRVQDLYAERDGFVWLSIADGVVLQKGAHELRLVVTGKNARSADFDLAIDFVELTPVCPAHPSILEGFP